MYKKIFSLLFIIFLYSCQGKLSDPVIEIIEEEQFSNFAISESTTILYSNNIGIRFKPESDLFADLVTKGDKSYEIVEDFFKVERVAETLLTVVERDHNQTFDVFNGRQYNYDARNKTISDASIGITFSDRELLELFGAKPGVYYGSILDSTSFFIFILDSAIAENTHIPSPRYEYFKEDGILFSHFDFVAYPPIWNSEIQKWEVENAEMPIIVRNEGLSYSLGINHVSNSNNYHTTLTYEGDFHYDLDSAQFYHEGELGVAKFIYTDLNIDQLVEQVLSK